jgi:hypothetical protein
MQWSEEESLRINGTWADSWNTRPSSEQHDAQIRN